LGVGWRKCCETSVDSGGGGRGKPRRGEERRGERGREDRGVVRAGIDAEFLEISLALCLSHKGILSLTLLSPPLPLPHPNRFTVFFGGCGIFV